MHIKITNGQAEAYSIGQLRRDNPQVSFPKEIPENLLAEYGVYIAALSQPPAHTETEVAEDAGFLQLADGTWVQVWSVRPLNEQELEEIAQQADERRRYAYQTEADPLFFKAQRGEATMQEWLAKVEEIKTRSK
jgi:hypothetical protein